MNCASRCLTKRSFETEQEALEQMAFLKVSKEYSKLKRAYKCTRCGNYHLTSKPDKYKVKKGVGYKSKKKRRYS